MSMSTSEIINVLSAAIASGFLWLHPFRGTRSNSYAKVLVARYNRGRLTHRMRLHAERLALEYKAETSGNLQGDVLGAADSFAQRSLKAQRAANLARIERAESNDAARAVAPITIADMRLAVASLWRKRNNVESQISGLKDTIKAWKKAERQAAKQAAKQAEQAALAAAFSGWSAESAEAESAEQAEPSAESAEAEQAEPSAEPSAEQAESAPSADVISATVEQVADEISPKYPAQTEAESAALIAAAEKQAKGFIQRPLAMMDLAALASHKENKRSNAQILLSEPSAEGASEWKVLREEVRIKRIEEGSRLHKMRYGVPGAAVLTDGKKSNPTIFAKVHPDGTIEKLGRGSYRIQAVDRAVALLCEFALDPVKRGAELGLLHKRCMFCRKKLSDPRSTSVGYGRDCASSYGLVWGDVLDGLDLEEVRSEYVQRQAERATKRAEALAQRRAARAEREARWEAGRAQREAERAKRDEERRARYQAEREAANLAEAKRREERQAQREAEAAAEAEREAAAEAEREAERLRKEDPGAARFANLDLD